MWKNKRDRKNVKISKYPKSVFAVYSIKGLNLDRFINKVKNKGITLYDIKKLNNKRLIVTVSYNDSQKFFAIAKEMCYNIKKVKEKGVLLPLVLAVRSIGVVIGCCLFIAITYFLSDFIYDISFLGTGSAYKREVAEYLNSKGIKRFSRFSSIDTQKLEDDILATCKNLSFVSVERQGNRLKIDMALSTEQVDRLDGNVYALYSTVTGTVEQINVYRGTPTVEVGDFITEGQLLVDGYMIIKEQTIKINVLASINVIVEQKFSFADLGDGAEDKALLFAEASLKDKQVLDLSVNKIQINNQFIYEVTAKYRAVIHTG